MSAAADITAARIIRYNEEGLRADVYDDETGEPIVLPDGHNPTVGYGCRCLQWSEPFARAVLSLQLEGFETPLLALNWYIACNDARRSALLEIAFNQGDSGLENGYPKMIAAVASSFWLEAQAQCTDGDPRLAVRYTRLGRILLTGQDQ